MSTETPAPSTQTAPKEPKIPSKLRKWLKRIGWTVLGVLVFFALLGRFSKEVYVGYGTVLEYFYNIQRDKVLAEYAKDTIGGETPEEVFDLLIDALKKGDIDRAVSYYDLPRQKEKRGDFERQLKAGGDFKVALNFFETVRMKGKKDWCGKNYENDNACVFVYKFITTEDATSSIKNSSDKIFIPKGSPEKWRVEILQNRFNNVWKIWRP
ncbi:MAG: hypothetical protein AAB552_01825 [Patescibacteria group bacterium]